MRFHFKKTLKTFIQSTIRLEMWLLVASTFLVIPAYSGNEHEHLQYLANYQDLASAMDLDPIPAKTLLSSNSDILLDLFPPETIYRLVRKPIPLYINGKLNFDGLREPLNQVTGNTTLKQLSDLIAKAMKDPHASREAIQRAFFEMTPETPGGKKAYLDMGVIRNRLYTQHPEALLPSIENALEHGATSDSTKTIFSIPSYLVDKHLTSNLRKAYLEKSFQVQLYATMPRNRLFAASPEFQKEFDALNTAMQAGVVDGVDIAGSVFENANPDAGNFDRLKNVFQLVSEQKAPLRIHMFEASNHGSFYNSFWKTLAECSNERCLPPVLRIGHIQALTKDDITKLSRYSGQTQLVFEANIDSNLVVQEGSSLQNLVHTIEALHQKNLPVVLGSDGLGFLGSDSAFEPTLFKLKAAGLSRSSLQRLIQEAYSPIPHTTMSQEQRARWQREEASVEEKILRQPKLMPVSVPSLCNRKLITLLQNAMP